MLIAYKSGIDLESAERREDLWLSADEIDYTLMPAMGVTSQNVVAGQRN
jgi:hypothetical protein